MSDDSSNGNGKIPLLSSMDSILESHSSKIEKIEDRIQEVGQEVLKTSLNLEFMKQKLEDSTKAIVDKIDDCLAPVAEKVRETSRKIENVAENVENHTKKLLIIEKDRLDAKNNIKVFKKIGWTILIGIIGIILKELAMLLTKVLHLRGQ